MTTENNEIETKTMSAKEAGLMVAYTADKVRPSTLSSGELPTCPTISNSRKGWTLEAWDEGWKNVRYDLTDDASKAAEWVQIYAMSEGRGEIRPTIVIDVTATSSQHNAWEDQPYGKPSLYWA